jgi:ABC-type lipoprotein export system ATPase subunit
MVTHDLDMAVMADRIMEMRDGVLSEHSGEHA